MKTILLGELLNKNTSLRKSLGSFTKVLYDVEKSIPFNLKYNFYNNLSTLKIELNLDKTKILKNFYSFGIYDAKENKIIIDSYAIKKFIKKNNINFNKGTIYLVTNNIIAASINYNNDEFTKVKEYIDIKNSDDNLEIIDVTNINNRERILIKNNKTYYRIPLTKYLENALFNKIPLIFEKDAMKVVAIIIRSNYIKDLYKYGYINDENNYMTKGISDIEKTNRYKFFIDKLNNAIKETDMMYLTYKDKPIYINSGNIFNINTLAKIGYNYNEILKLLYPGLELSYESYF